MTALALRSIGSNDYYVIDAGEPVGLIRLASERRGEVWMWSVGVLIPAPPYGTSDSLESAKVAFKDAWRVSFEPAGRRRSPRRPLESVATRHLKSLNL